MEPQVQVAGNVAQRLNLPIPNFKQAIIPIELVSLSARDDIADLGAGTGFASQFIENADELSYLFTNQIDAALRSKILLFDWWVANGDRTLTEFGGNPNILWLHRDSRPYIIDHNMAFDETASRDFWRHHIFAADRASWTPRLRTEMETHMRSALDDLSAWWNTMPAQWTEIDTGLTFDSVRTLLWRFHNTPATFWEAQ